MWVQPPQSLNFTQVVHLIRARDIGISWWLILSATDCDNMLVPAISLFHFLASIEFSIQHTLALQNLWEGSFPHPLHQLVVYVHGVFAICRFKWTHACFILLLARLQTYSAVTSLQRIDAHWYCYHHGDDIINGWGRARARQENVGVVHVSADCLFYWCSDINASRVQGRKLAADKHTNKLKSIAG